MHFLKVSRGVSFGAMALCLVCFLVAFCSSYWHHHSFEGFIVHKGLWRMCDKWLDTCFKVPGSDMNSAGLKGTQMAMTVSLCLYVASAVCYGLWFSQSDNFLNEHGTTPVSIASVCLFIGAGLFTCVSTAIFGSMKCLYCQDSENPYGWSFYVAVASGCLAIVSGVPVLTLILVCVGRLRSRPLYTGTQIPVDAIRAKQSTEGHGEVKRPEGQTDAVQGTSSSTEVPPQQHLTEHSSPQSQSQSQGHLAIAAAAEPVGGSVVCDQPRPVPKPRPRQMPSYSPPLSHRALVIPPTSPATVQPREEERKVDLAALSSSQQGPVVVPHGHQQPSATPAHHQQPQTQPLIAVLPVQPPSYQEVTATAPASQSTPLLATAPPTPHQQAQQQQQQQPAITAPKPLPRSQSGFPPPGYEKAPL